MIEGEMQTAGKLTSYSTIETVQRMVLQILLSRKDFTVWRQVLLVLTNILFEHSSTLFSQEESKILIQAHILLTVL